MTTGERLKRAMARKKLDQLSQAEAARFLDVPPGTLSEWLNDKYEPSLESLRKLSDKLGCSVAALIGSERAS